MRLTSPFKPSETARNLVASLKVGIAFDENGGDDAANLLVFIAGLENELRTAQSEITRLNLLIEDIRAEVVEDLVASDQASTFSEIPSHQSESGR